MTLPLVPLRGEVWEAAVPRAGRHPVIVLSARTMLQDLRRTVVALVTGTEGPRTTHVPLGPEAGLTRYAESYCDLSTLWTLPVSALHTRRGRLSLAELGRVERTLADLLGLDLADDLLG